MKPGPCSCKQCRVKLELRLSLKSSFEGPGAAPGDVMGFGQCVQVSPVSEKWIFDRHVSADLGQGGSSDLAGFGGILFVMIINPTNLQGDSPPRSLGED